MTREVFICEGVRTPFGRFGGALSSRSDRRSRGAPISALMGKPPRLELGASSMTCFYGCANQAGEDNRNVAEWRSARGPSLSSARSTINRLCASGIDAVAVAARAIRWAR